MNYEELVDMDFDGFISGAIDFNRLDNENATSHPSVIYVGDHVALDPHLDGQLDSHLSASPGLLHLPPQVHHLDHLQQHVDQAEEGGEEEADDRRLSHSPGESYHSSCSQPPRQQKVQVVLLSQDHLVKSLLESSRCARLVWLQESETLDLVRRLDRCIDFEAAVVLVELNRLYDVFACAICDQNT